MQSALHRNSNLTPRRRPFWLMKPISAARHCAQLYSERHRWLEGVHHLQQEHHHMCNHIAQHPAQHRVWNRKTFPLQRKKEQWWAHLTCRIPTGCNACGVWRERGWGREGGRFESADGALSQREKSCRVLRETISDANNILRLWRRRRPR